IYNEQFRGYRLSKDYWKLKCDQLDTARESFLSAIEAEGFMFENPYGTKPHKMDYEVLTEEFDKDSERWQLAQERVIDLTRCYIFVSDIESEYKRNVDSYAKEKFRK